MSIGLDLYHPLPLKEEESIAKYAQLEREYMIRHVPGDGGYFKDTEKKQFRDIAVFRILQYSRIRNSDVLIPYLGMNYFDRYLSENELPNISGSWIYKLDILAISCLSLAWKARNNSFNISRFLVKRNYQSMLEIMEKGKDIMDVELQVLQALKWKMSSITPLCFLPFLVDVSRLPKSLTKRTITRVIVDTQDDINFTVFKPSIIAASVVFVAHMYLNPTDQERFKDKLKSLDISDKKELHICMTLVGEMCHRKYKEGQQNLISMLKADSAVSLNQQIEGAPEEQGAELGEDMNWELKWVTNSQARSLLYRTEDTMENTESLQVLQDLIPFSESDWFQCCNIF